MNNLSKSYVIWSKRTPTGKIAGSLASVRPDDLLATLMSDFKNHSNFSLTEIDDIVIGCANQAGEDNRNVARMSMLLAQFPFEVPAATTNRLCGSGLEALIDGHCKISAGLADCILVGGVESMTRAPYVLGKSSSPFDRNQKMFDSSFGWRFVNDRMKELFPIYTMGETAEEVAKQLQIKREDQDQFAFNSHKKAAHAHSSEWFKDEIVPVTVTEGKSTQIISNDECVRADTSLDKLAKLKPVFKTDGTVTAGNSSPMNDGASLICIVSENFLKRHNLKPHLKVLGGVSRGLHPNVMGLGPVHSTEKLCQKLNLKISDFDVIELNEAFAAQSLGCIQKLGLDQNKINLWGGAIALGHPLGSSGTRLVTTMNSIMTKNPKFKLGLATMCIGVGQGISVAVENCHS